MKMRILQTLPGTIGDLPPGEDYLPGRDYEVDETLAGTMWRNGWAKPSPVEAAAPAEPAETPAPPPRSRR